MDLNRIALESIELAAALVQQRKFGLSRELFPAPVPIVGDRIQLQQVILNLVVNAMDAMEAAPPGARMVLIMTTRQQHVAELSVTDDGTGIQPERLKQIFQPFYTTKEGGMGMGLSIARSITQAHGGEIRAENRPGGGAAFIVTLPLNGPT